MNIVANNTTRIISEKGYTKKAVAKRSGLPLTTLDAMLTGKSPINAICVILLAHALRCSPNELFADITNSIKNIKPSGLCTVPSGPLAGTSLPLYEMTNADPDRLFREKGSANDRLVYQA